MKHVRLFEEFISEEATQVTPESDVKVDDYTTDAGKEIKSTEIVGAIVSSETEKEFTDYLYSEYGNAAFTEGDISTLVTYYNEYQEELNAEEAEEEADAEAEEETVDTDSIDTELEDLEDEV